MSIGRYSSGGRAGLRHPLELIDKALEIAARPEVRLVLYMAALSAARCNPLLRTLYKRLRANGKLSKVALTAVMRRLLAYMNHRLKALLSKTATAKAEDSNQA